MVSFSRAIVSGIGIPLFVLLNISIVNLIIYLPIDKIVTIFFNEFNGFDYSYNTYKDILIPNIIIKVFFNLKLLAIKKWAVFLHPLLLSKRLNIRWMG